VQAGQVLVRLDPTSKQAEVDRSRAALAAARKQLAILEQGARPQERAMARNAVIQAEAQLKDARTNLERMRNLYQEGAVAQQQVDTAQTHYEVALAQRDTAGEQARLTEIGPRKEEIGAAREAVGQARAMLRYAQQELTYTTIRSPAAGIVYERGVEPGEAINPGVPLLKIAVLDEVYFEALVSERQIGAVAPGLAAQIAVDALPGRTFVGKVRRVLPVAEAGSRDFRVKVALPNPEGLLRPGMFARGRVLVSRREGAVLVPGGALVRREGKSVVFTVQGGRARQRPVVTGLEGREEVEVVSGLKAGEQVVTAGHQGLRGGERVSAQSP